MLMDVLHNASHNLFKPLLLFFYMGFLIPLLRVPFEFPHVLYQGLTMYLLLAIGWHGGEELSLLKPEEFASAAGLVGVGVVTNFIIGCLAYVILRSCTRLRKIDAATVAGYYGSDSAGTFVTCVGVLTASNIAFAAYMPVCLAAMEIPGCLVALFIVSQLRQRGNMDVDGNAPGEPNYDPNNLAVEGNGNGHGRKSGLMAMLDPHLLHEVFLNPGLFLLFGGIMIGYISGLQGKSVTGPDDEFFVKLFQGALCLFLLEMGMTACKRLPDLKLGGWQFIAYGLLAPNLFAIIGLTAAHLYSHAANTHLELGTYVLFMVLCGAASYIAVPAVQRLAIPEASPTLPLAASLGLTFSWNVTIGIPIYIEVAKAVINAWPLVATSAGT